MLRDAEAYGQHVISLFITFCSNRAFFLGIQLFPTSTVTSCQRWRSKEKVYQPALAPLEPVVPDSRTPGVKSFSKFDGR